MSIWTFLNGAAWVVSAVLVLIMLGDFIKVERRARADKREKQRSDTFSDQP